MKRWLLALWLVPLVGCADSGPAGPTTVSRDLSAPATSFGFVAGTSLSFVSGETGHPVPGARVVIAGRDFISDGAGRVLLSELAPNGATVDIEANGFLERKTLVRRGEVTNFELWPSESPTRMDANYSRALVYDSATLESAGAAEPMDRPSLDTPRVALIPDGVLAGDERAMVALRSAALEITDALRGEITYNVGDDPSAMPVALMVEPENAQIVSENLRALTRCWRTRLVITRCEIVFKSVEVARSDTALHELGHTFGLNHSPDRREIMGVRRLAAPESFSPRERLVMAMMLKRLPGNLFPDNDRQAPALRASQNISTVVCRHP